MHHIYLIWVVNFLLYHAYSSAAMYFISFILDFFIVRFLLILFKFEWYTAKNLYIIWRSCQRILLKIWHYGLKIVCIYGYITKDYIILYHIINMVRIIRLYICACCDLLFAHTAACCLRIMRLIICAYCGLLLAHNAAFLLGFLFYRHFMAVKIIENLCSYGSNIIWKLMHYGDEYNE